MSLVLIDPNSGEKLWIFIFENENDCILLGVKIIPNYWLV
jgi:hypothetical protein